MIILNNQDSKRKLTADFKYKNKKETKEVWIYPKYFSKDLCKAKT